MSRPVLDTQAVLDRLEVDVPGRGPTRLSDMTPEDHRAYHAQVAAKMQGRLAIRATNRFCKVARMHTAQVGIR